MCFSIQMQKKSLMHYFEQCDPSTSFKSLVDVDRHRRHVWTCIKRYNHLINVLLQGKTFLSLWGKSLFSNNFATCTTMMVVFIFYRDFTLVANFLVKTMLQRILCYNTLQSLVHCPMLYNLCVSSQTASESCVTTLPAWSAMRFWTLFLLCR